jgi:hypothetical protein
MSQQEKLGLMQCMERGKDLYLCHTGVDKQWVEQLAQRVEAETYHGRLLGVVFDKWDFGKGANIVAEIEREIDACRFVGVVVTKAMLNAAWPTLERSIAVWSDPSGARARVTPLLRENVTLPASLRIRNWIDFRDDNRFEEAFAELIRLLRGEPIPRGRGGLLPTVPEIKLPYEPAPVVITSSVGADVVQERLIANLFPIVELPPRVYAAATALRDKAEVSQCCGSKNLPAFIMREKKLFTFSPLREELNPLREAVHSSEISEAVFSRWFGEADRKRWAIELLNVSLKQHAWQRHLRLDSVGKRYFFSPYKGRPKSLRWRVGTKWSRRGITIPHMAKRSLEDGRTAEYQIGWRHQGFRASFIHVPFGLFLRIEPTWLLTQMDGKTPRGGPHVGPILAHWLNQERNGQVLRSVRFWSLVLSRGKSEIGIETGQTPIRVALTPATGMLGFGIRGDWIDYDELMRAEMEDDLAMPQLGLFPEDTGILPEEDGEAIE